MAAKLVVKFPKDVFASARQTNCVKLFYFGFYVLLKVPPQTYHAIWLHHSNRNNKHYLLLISNLEYLFLKERGTGVRVKE